MKTLKIFGYSDDLLEIRSIEGRWEFFIGDTPYAGKIAVKGTDGLINIHVIYDGSWAFAIAPQDGDCDTLPPWNIRRTFGADEAYSETIEIDLPDNAVWEFEKS